MDFNLLTSLNDNIRVDRTKCTACGRCVEVCVLDNLRLQLSPCAPGLPRGDELPGVYPSAGPGENGQRTGKGPGGGSLRGNPGKDLLPALRSNMQPARLKMGVLAYNLLQMIRQFYVWGEEVKRSIDWLIKRLIKVGARVSYHARRWYVHLASAFPLAHHYRAVLAWG